ncbi:hypothetical protein C4J81_11110 [Deltaproteobacteria bacterium Smac51]|nr:hypothetical protein C4J81_11110 [Deltaproteobacteria bacterium Smac51]
MSDDKLKHIETLFSEGKTAEALELLEAFLETEPHNLRALNDLGAIRQSQGDGAGAEQAFLRALEVDPDRTDTRGNLVLALCVQEKWEEAKEQLNKLLAVNQNDSRLWALLARVEKSLGNLRGAVEYLDRCLLIDPDQPDLKETRDKMAREAEKSPAVSPSSSKKPVVLMCCQKGLDHFAMQLCDELEKTAVIKRTVGNNMGEFHWPIRSASTVWLEWGSDMAIEVTNHPQLLDGKRVIVRIHSYEVLNGMAAKINYGRVNDVIFVSNYMRQLFERRFPNRFPEATRVHVIHNGIALDKFPFEPGGNGRRIAFVGKMDAKKDPMLMVHAFQFLLHRHPDVELHVAGAPDDNRYYIAMPDFLAKNKLGASTNFYGHVKDVPKWLADKDYILCTSPFESQGVGLLEAMHRGLKPLIYNFPGAEFLYPRNWLWNNLDELEALMLNGPTPEECRDFVAEHYSMTRQAANFMKVLTTEETIVEAPPAVVTEE